MLGWLSQIFASHVVPERGKPNTSMADAARSSHRSLRGRSIISVVLPKEKSLLGERAVSGIVFSVSVPAGKFFSSRSLPVSRSHCATRLPEVLFYRLHQ